MTIYTSNSTPTVFVDNSCPLKTLPFTISSYIIPTISGVGIIANTWCVAVFAMIIYKERHNNHMFKYLLLKALHDDIQFLIQIFAPLYYCSTCSTYQTYASQIWYIWFYYYVECVNELCSGFYEVAAAFDCLININKKFECCKKNLYFYVISVAVFVFSAVYYIFFLYNFKITGYVRVIDAYFDANLNTTVANQTREYFLYEYTEFASTDLSKVFSRGHGMLRDVITLVVLVILNGMILLTIKRSVQMKKNMTMSGGNAQQQAAVVKRPKHGSVRAAEEAQRNVTIMIVLIGINYFGGHFTSFVRYLFLVDKPSPFRSCFVAISEFLFYLSYVTPFFIYFGYNKVFRAYALGLKRPRVAEISVARTRTLSPNRT
jgi:hypothetical protein